MQSEQRPNRPNRSRRAPSLCFCLLWSILTAVQTNCSPSSGKENVAGNGSCRGCHQTTRRPPGDTRSPGGAPDVLPTPLTAALVSVLPTMSRLHPRKQEVIAQKRWLVHRKGRHKKNDDSTGRGATDARDYWRRFHRRSETAGRRAARALRKRRTIAVGIYSSPSPPANPRPLPR